MKADDVHQAPVVVELAVPSLARVVPDPAGARSHVFDAWAWCESDVLEWRRPRTARLLESAAIDADNPPDLLFVCRPDADCAFLPRELARLHAPRGYALEDDWALAPWAIDDATDLFYERRVRPRDVLWLGAPSLRALVWGLHDWVHFHNHGPFDEPAMTELQCDLVALAWLRLNREVIGVGPRELETVARELAGLSRDRFATEKKASPVADLEALFAAPYPGDMLRVSRE